MGIVTISFCEYLTNIPICKINAIVNYVRVYGLFSHKKMQAENRKVFDNKSEIYTIKDWIE